MMMFRPRKHRTTDACREKFSLARMKQSSFTVKMPKNKNELSLSECCLKMQKSKISQRNFQFCLFFLDKSMKVVPNYN